MCGRSSLTKTEKELEQRFNATFYSEDLERYNPLPNFNIAPTHICPVILSRDATRINVLRWGMIPSWSKDIKMGYKMINARIETIKSKSTYSSAISNRRCLVPLTGFYEWKKSGDLKQPYNIFTTDQEIFTMAGMWDSWKSPSGEIIYSFTIITTPPNEMMANIHDRMPAILTPEKESLWLDESLPPKSVIKLLEEPYPSDLMSAYKVSAKVGNVRETGPELVEPIDLDEIN